MPIRLIRWASPIAAAAVLLSACETGPADSVGAGPNTRPAPLATLPTSSALDSVDWVVEGSATSRGVAGETFSVICVARAEFGWDQIRQTHVREVQTDRRTSYNTPDGTACPKGPILTEW